MSSPRRRAELRAKFEKEHMERLQKENEQQAHRDASTLYCLVDELTGTDTNDLLKYILHRIISEAGIE
jgi:hypothetical protein